MPCRLTGQANGVWPVFGATGDENCDGQDLSTMDNGLLAGPQNANPVVKTTACCYNQNIISFCNSF